MNLKWRFYLPLSNKSRHVTQSYTQKANERFIPFNSKLVACYQILLYWKMVTYIFRYFRRSYAVRHKLWTVVLWRILALFPTLSRSPLNSTSWLRDQTTEKQINCCHHVMKWSLIYWFFGSLLLRTRVRIFIASSGREETGLRSSIFLFPGFQGILMRWYWCSKKCIGENYSN